MGGKGKGLEIVISLNQKGDAVVFEASDSKYIRNLDYHFNVEKPGAIFIRRMYGGSAGNHRFFKMNTRALPLGLFKEAVSWTKKYFPKTKITISKQVKDAFINPEYRNYNYDFVNEGHGLYEHQVQLIEKCLLVKRSVIEAYVSSGKTAVFGAVADTLISEGECKKGLIIVPLTQLVEQTADEIVERTGFKYSDICLHCEGRDLDVSKKLIISTWQSLNYVTGRLKKSRQEAVKELAKEVDLLICDETHTTKADIVNKIIQQFDKATYRHGFTGTLPKQRYERYMIMSVFGSVVGKVGARELRKKNIISEAQILNLKLKYSTAFKKSLTDLDYDPLRFEVFKHPGRLELLYRLVMNAKKNVLILVNNIDDEGEMLKEYLTRNIPDKEIVFLSGRDSVSTRRKYSKAAEKRDDLVIVATFGIFKMGISIRNIHYLIFASSVKAMVTVKQSLGRGLRNMKDKILTVYNIVDMVRILKGHGKQRSDLFKEDGWKTVDKEINIT